MGLSRDSPSRAWDVSFYGGLVYDYDKTYRYFVRCVRGGPTPAPSFHDNANGTVSDSVTGLMWQQGDGQNDSLRTWKGALDYCEDLELPEGGYTDWRLPNVRELESIVDLDRYSPAIDTAYFPDSRSFYYWSSSTHGDSPSRKWDVGFGDGRVGGFLITSTRYVRCVRAGPGGDTQILSVSAIAEDNRRHAPDPGGSYYYYVDPYLGTCGGKTPCYSMIQDAIDAANYGATIKILQGSYDEALAIDSPKNLTISGGWDSTFTTQSSFTTVNSLTIYGSGGTITVDYLILASSSPTGGKIPDTGQTRCYDEINISIPCPERCQDFYGQDGNYKINPSSYTKLDVNGNNLPDSAISWTMVRDNVTGLIWEVKTAGGSIHSKYDTYTWKDAQDIFIATLNASYFGGYSDWHLPTIKELAYLATLREYGEINYFPNTQLWKYWSSTAKAGSAWLIKFQWGQAGSDYKSGRHYVRAVRGEQHTTSFVDNGNGTVTDLSTGLMWQQVTASSKMSWKKALSYCEGLFLGGYTDWRLPNLKELRSIVDYETDYPAIDTDFFPDTAPDKYWQSTTVGSGSSTLFIWFTSGYDQGQYKYVNGYVRCVRGGQ